MKTDDKIEEKYDCNIGLSEETDTILVLPSNEETMDEVKKSIEFACESILEYTLLHRPFGLELVPPSEKSANHGTDLQGEEIDDCYHTSGVMIAVMGHEAERIGIKDKSYLQSINGVHVQEMDYKDVTQMLLNADLPVKIITGVSPISDHVSVIRYPMYKSSYLMVDWDEIMETSDVQVVPLNHADADKYDVSICGEKEGCSKALKLLKDKVNNIEIIDISDVAFVLKQSDCRVYNRLKFCCQIDGTDLSMPEFYHTTRIAIYGNLVQREKFKSYINNIKLNLLKLIADGPIDRELKIIIRRKVGAIMEVSNKDPQVCRIHDSLFHPGNGVRKERLMKVLETVPAFQNFKKRHNVVWN